MLVLTLKAVMILASLISACNSFPVATVTESSEHQQQSSAEEAAAATAFADEPVSARPRSPSLNKPNTRRRIKVYISDQRTLDESEKGNELYAAFGSANLAHAQQHHRQRHSGGHKTSALLPSAERIFSAQYEHLCATEVNTVHLNTWNEEFNPPFYVEVRCKRNSAASSSNSNSWPATTPVQKCAFDFLHCVQTYRTYHFSRRKAGTECWQPYTIEVASSCECMWPVDELGQLRYNQHEDL